MVNSGSAVLTLYLKCLRGVSKPTRDMVQQARPAVPKACTMWIPDTAMQAPCAASAHAPATRKLEAYRRGLPLVVVQSSVRRHAYSPLQACRLLLRK